jgi:ribosomal 50S subunit-recycling heat shock protein
VANEACDAAHVTVNGRSAKASYDVKVGDIIEVTFGAKALRIRVLEVKETVGKDAASTLYEVVES